MRRRDLLKSFAGAVAALVGWRAKAAVPEPLDGLGGSWSADAVTSVDRGEIRFVNVKVTAAEGSGYVGPAAVIVV